MDLEKFNLKSRRLRHGHICPGCGEEFRSNRPDAVTCSARCRKRYQRKCDGITLATASVPKLDGMEVPIREDKLGPGVTKAKEKRRAKRKARLVAFKKNDIARRTTRSKPTKKGGKKK